MSDIFCDFYSCLYFIAVVYFIYYSIIELFPVLRHVEGRYEGKFFGPNAEEVAGLARFKERKQKAIFGKLEDLNTSFSAEKQPKK